MLPNGGAEQDADEWWNAMCSATKELVGKTGTDTKTIDGITFCSQMQRLVLVDEDGIAVRRPMSYMDQRSGKEMKETESFGLQVSGVNVGMLIKSLVQTTAASTSVKDPLWKYKWVRKNEPEVFRRVHKWLDVKEYLICRCTGEFVMTRDSAYSTFLYDSRKGKGIWSESLCKMYGVDMRHLPEIKECTDIVGRLTKKAAEELGLSEGTPVFGGGGDATLIGIGAGCTEIGDTHIYSDTSGWVGTIIDKQVVDIECMIAGIVGAENGKYNYFAEMETAGKCFEWVMEHLVLDEVNAYLEKVCVTDSKESIYESLYDYMSDVISKVSPGCGGVIFTPWLHGNRCPFEDPAAAGMFFNLKLETGKAQMIRAVLEGICYHLRWMLESEDKKIRTSQTIRFVGGGALSKVTCQMLADITGRRIETVADTKDVGAVGAALLAAVGSGEAASSDVAKKLIAVENVYEPDPAAKATYDRNFEVFKKLYASNVKNFKALNSVG
ncbi:MAG: FGGY-family carbohydrate kinase [Lachnospiraceae bacterium]|nr:FGGY-family carbohydrate kinase [Lachnospiraceae bacterium]